MVLLDLSRVFDSLRHDILISRLEMIGINGSTLKWFNPYILNRSSVKFCDLSSNHRPTLRCPTRLYPMSTSIIHI